MSGLYFTIIIITKTGRMLRYLDSSSCSLINDLGIQAPKSNMKGWTKYCLSNWNLCVCVCVWVYVYVFMIDYMSSLWAS